MSINLTCMSVYDVVTLKKILCQIESERGDLFSLTSEREKFQMHTPNSLTEDKINFIKNFCITGATMFLVSVPDDKVDFLAEAVEILYLYQNSNCVIFFHLDNVIVPIGIFYREDKFLEKNIDCMVKENNSLFKKNKKFPIDCNDFGNSFWKRKLKIESGFFISLNTLVSDFDKGAINLINEILSTEKNDCVVSCLGMLISADDQDSFSHLKLKLRAISQGSRAL